MKTIKLKKSFLRFYLSLIILLGITITIGVSIIIFGYQNLFTGNREFKHYALILFGLLFLLLGYIGFRSFIRNTISLKIKDSIIHYKNQEIEFDQIAEVILRRRFSFGLIIGFSTYATSIILKNKEKITIVDYFYSNTWIIKSYLNQVFIEKTNYEPFEINSENIDSEINDTSREFKGNLIFSLRGLYLTAFPLFLLLLLSLKPINIIPLWLKILGLILYFFIEFLTLFYFRTNSLGLIISNHIIPFQRSFQFKDIYDIQFISRSKLPNRIIITTKDFKSHSYFAGTLREDKEWKDLRDVFLKNDITVRNEGVIL